MENRKLRGTFLASKEIIYNYFNNYFIFIYNLMLNICTHTNYMTT